MSRAPPARSTSVDRGGVPRLRRAPHDPADQVGGEEVLHRHRVLRRDLGQPGAGGLQACRGRRVAVGPAVDRRRAVAGLAVQRQVRPRGARSRGRARRTRWPRACGWPGRGTPAAPAARPRWPGRACTAETIAESGSTRPGATSRRRAMSSRACQSERAACRADGGCAARARPTCAARGRPWGAAGRRRGSPRTPAAPSRSCPAPRGSRRGRRGGRRAPRRPAPRRPATPRAAAGCSSRRRECPFCSEKPSSDSTTAPDRRAADRPAGRRARCRRSAPGTSPISARQGRSWLAACSTHSCVGDRVLDDREVGKGHGVDQRRCPSRCGAAGPGRRAARSGSPEARSASTATGPVPGGEGLGVLDELGGGLDDRAGGRPGGRGAAWRRARRRARLRRPPPGPSPPAGEWPRCSVAVHLLAGPRRVTGPCHGSLSRIVVPPAPSSTRACRGNRKGIAGSAGVAPGWRYRC